MHTIDLTGLWRFQPDPYHEGEGLGWHTPGHDIRFWREVRVPCVFDRCGPTMPGYEGEGWFRREVAIPAAWAGKRIELAFTGVNYRARVWVNGRLVGEHEDGFLPFAFPIEDYATPGETAVIVVRADNERLPGEVPGMERGWRPYGGILREVMLNARDRLRLTRLTIQGHATGDFDFNSTVSNDRTEPTLISLQLSIRDCAGVEVGRIDTRQTTVRCGSYCDICGGYPIPEVSLWSPDHPAVYTASVTLLADGEPIEERTIRFGFRTIEARGEQLLLNGEPIYLTGCNRHEDSPRTDMCVDLAQARADFLDMKAMGMNFVRLCHYPHHPGELDLCDEIGLLAMAEIPLYWWNGLTEGEAHCARKLAAARRQVEAMIARDMSHPSVIFWSVGNECDEERPEVAQGLQELVRHARMLDPTRLAVHVAHRWDEFAHFEHDDVVCVNSYPTFITRGMHGKAEHTPTDSKQWWSDNLARLHARYPGKPILVTEFGMPTLEDVTGCVVGEDIQVEAIHEEYAGMGAPYVCGAVVWCYADHPWPEEDFVRYTRISPYGLLTRERRRKPAYETVKTLFRTRQGLPIAAPQVVISDNMGVGMIRPHMRDISQFAFPAGFGIRPMQPGEGAIWTDIHRDAEQYFTIDDGLFTREFGYDLEATTWRCFFIIDECGSAVGTLSAWYDRDIYGLDYGRIHWVALRHAYRGMGLIKPAMTHAMNVMAQWHERAYLSTSTGRIPAIKVYLDFGFLPDMQRPGAKEAWAQVAKVLEHPALLGFEKA